VRLERLELKVAGTTDPEWLLCQSYALLEAPPVQEGAPIILVSPGPRLSTGSGCRPHRTLLLFISFLRDDRQVREHPVGILFGRGEARSSSSAGSMMRRKGFENNPGRRDKRLVWAAGLAKQPPAQSAVVPSVDKVEF
jgi:hypothetical protein